VSTRTSAPRSRALALAAMAAVSLALHAGGFAVAVRLEPRPASTPAPLVVDFEAVAPPPAPDPITPSVRPPSRRVAASELPPRSAEPPPPPPPNETPPPETPRARAAPRVGLSLSSTTTAGGLAVGVGNTLYGKPSEVAADPAEVKPYAPDRTEPPARLSARPRLVERPEIPYPKEARNAGVAGQVVLLLRIDGAGRVAGARVLADPGSGLGEAARQAALRFRFTPALLEGEPVETEIRFTYTFVLE